MTQTNKTYIMEKGKLSVEKLEKAAGVLRAIAHPQRIRIIESIEPEKEYTVSQLQEMSGLAQAKVSHHLGILRTRSVVNARREGRNVYYSLSHNLIAQIVDCIEQCSKEI